MIALLSDIHGNRWALEAVVDDIRRRGIETVLNAGDSLYGPLDPAGTAAIILMEKFASVSGNEDRLLVESRGRAEACPTVRYCLDGLSERHMEWLAQLPATLALEESILLCHGTPFSDGEYLLEKFVHGEVILRAAADLQAALATVTQSVVLCGHSHVARSAWLPSGTLIVNPGSVGLPAYRDDEPVLHAMEAGTPHARYAALDRTRGSWRFEHVAVPYDWESAARAAEEHGRADWGQWLRTGRAAVRRAARSPARKHTIE